MSRARNLRRRRPEPLYRLAEGEHVFPGTGGGPTVQVAPADGSGPWQPLAGVTFDEVAHYTQPEPAPIPAPLSPWQREKLRQTYGATALRARWVVGR